MATKYFLGTAPAVAQVSTCIVGTYSASTTYTITIGGISVSVVGSGGTAITTATALVAALNATTEPYFAAITWSNVGGTSATITATADTAGCPFIFSTLTASGTGTFTGFSNGSPGTMTAGTANSCPNDLGVAANYSDGAVPTTGDTLIIANHAVHIAWGLDLSAVTLALLQDDESYTGNVGLNYTGFATSADGQTINTACNEYRDVYLKISATSHVHASTSQRFCINYGSNAATVNILNTASKSQESSRGAPATRILCNHSSTVINVRSAPGGVGIAFEKPNETSTLATLNISDTSGKSDVSTGRGVTVTTVTSVNGSHAISSNNNITTMTVHGGTMTTEGTMAIAALVINGGTVNSNHTGSFTTIAGNGGTLVGTQSPTARALGTVTIKTGFVLQIDPAVCTYTALTLSGRQKITAASLT